MLASDWRRGHLVKMVLSEKGLVEMKSESITDLEPNKDDDLFGPFVITLQIHFLQTNLVKHS